MESVKDLIGLTFRSVSKVSEYDDDIIIFTTVDGDVYKLYHEQDCCEHVCVEKITGGLELLENSEIENVIEEFPDMPQKDEYDESYTWTKYVFTTKKGSVEILWYGMSNGYYSESVNFLKVSKKRK